MLMGLHIENVSLYNSHIFSLNIQKIGWRDDALKMVFLVTDQNYHVAGDGKVHR